MALTDRDKKRIISSGIFIFLAALLFWLYSSNSNRKKARDIPMAQNIKVGVDLMPYEFGIDSMGMITGIQKDLMEILLPTDTVIWIPFSSRSQAIQALAQETIDLYATSLPYSVSHDYRGIIPTEWLYHSKFSLLYHPKEADWAERFSGIDKVNVSVSREDKAARMMLENLSELTYPAVQIDEHDISPHELGLLLKKGEITYMICNSRLASAIAAMDTTILITENITLDTRQVWLVNKRNTQLLNKINERILNNRDTEEWKNVTAK